MTPEQLTAAAAHSREAMTAIRHIAQHGGVSGMTYVMTSAEDVPGLLAHIEALEAEAAEWQKVAADRAEQVRTVTRRLLAAREATTQPADGTPAELSGKQDRHARTSHGHPCCGQAPSERPNAIARCGGVRMCKVCGAERDAIHGTSGKQDGTAA